MTVPHYGCALLAGWYASVGLSDYMDVALARVVACIAVCVYVIWRDR